MQSIKTKPLQLALFISFCAHGMMYFSISSNFFCVCRLARLIVSLLLLLAILSPLLFFGNKVDNISDVTVQRFANLNQHIHAYRLAF